MYKRKVTIPSSLISPTQGSSLYCSQSSQGSPNGDDTAAKNPSPDTKTGVPNIAHRGDVYWQHGIVTVTVSNVAQLI